MPPKRGLAQEMRDRALSLRINMSRHIALFTMGTTMWTAFFLAGLPSDYFQTWPLTASLWLIVILPTLVLMGITFARIRGMSRSRALAACALTAFYFTAPFFAYDWLLLGVHERRGFTFLSTHWYLTAFYFTPWMALPWLPLLLPRQQRSGAAPLQQRHDG